MLLVGLTGGIATGKSSVSKHLSSKLTVLDADAIYHDLLQPGQAAHTAILQGFPDASLLLKPDGQLDRAKLGELVFNDARKRACLNRLTHPLVRWALIKRLLLAWLYYGDRVVVLDIPLLIETGLYQWMGLVVVVAW